MTYTKAQVEHDMARPENRGRIAVYCHLERGIFSAEWDGQKFEAGNPFGLDSKLSEAGVPAPRNLYLMNND